MYKLTCKTGQSFTCPEKSIRALALIKAMDRKVTNWCLDTNEDAIAFLTSLGITIEKI